MIGVFDSGIGGLTVFREIARRFPALDVHYLGDTARVPYGTKSPETVVRYSFEAAHFLRRRGIDLLVVACNTSSAIALDALALELPIPVIGVVKAGARRAAAVTRNGRIGVIGTPATIKSGAYTREIHAARAGTLAPSTEDISTRRPTGPGPTYGAPGGADGAVPGTRPKEKELEAASPQALSCIEVHTAACPLFVPLAEEGWTDNSVARETARIYLDPLARRGIDTLVLGCTHYPVFSRTIAEVMGPGVTLVDSAEPVADEVAERLRALGRDPARGAGEWHFFVTDNWERFREVGGRFLGRPIDRLELVDIVGE